MQNDIDENDFISLYLKYTDKTECPTLFHRWTAMSCLAAWLGRRVYFPFGHFKVHANMYVMFVGLAGTKKSTAIKIGSKFLKKAGYKYFAADKTRQEKFLIDLAEQQIESEETDILDLNLFGDGPEVKTPAECFVAADEVNNFIGVGNLEFMSLLGDLWDYDDVFTYRLKNSNSVSLYYPTINILSGNTFEGFNRLFPQEAIGTGFFSRLIFVNAEPTGIKYTVMPTPDPAISEAMIDLLDRIRNKLSGAMALNDNAFKLLDHIYKKDIGVNDTRFDAYNNRRLLHLLKLCMITAASRNSINIEELDVVKANTVLAYTEHFMPKALGEFGKSKSSGAVHKIMEILGRTKVPLNFQELWKHTHQDLESRDQLVRLIGDLQLAGKIQPVEGGGFLPINEPIKEAKAEDVIDWSLLTDKERELI